MGEIPDFTGVSSPYEVPVSPDITVDTAGRQIDDCVADILDKLASFLN